MVYIQMLHDRLKKDNLVFDKHLLWGNNQHLFLLVGLSDKEKYTIFAGWIVGR